MDEPSVPREVTELAGVPDLYVDEFWFVVHGDMCTMTLLAGVPPEPNSGQPATRRVVGRIRMHRSVAADVAHVVSGQLAPAPPPTRKAPKKSN